jgi:hypothetical protein
MKGPPTGFGRGVNDYLNYYVTVADAKATAFLAGNLTAVTLLLTLDPKTPISSAFRWLSFVSFVVSTGFCAWAIFPRLPSGRLGAVFWEDIQFFKKVDEYENQLSKLDEPAVEVEYAHQNWHVSAVVHKKFRAVQWAILFFFAAVGLGLSSYLTLS